MGKHQAVRRKTYTVTVPHNGWSTPFSLDYMGSAGKLAQSILRAAAASGVTAVTLLVYQGNYTSSTNPATVPDDAKVFERTGIVVAGSATVADDDYNILLNRGGAVYDIALALAAQTVSGSGLWAAIEGTAGAAPESMSWMISAVDVV